MAKHRDVCCICMVFLYVWCCSHCSQDDIRTVNMIQKTDQNNFLYTDFVLMSTYAKSLVDCAKLCVEETGAQSMTFWRKPPSARESCVCYAVKSSSLSDQTPAQGARFYSLEGVMSIECSTPPSVVGATASSTSGHMGDQVTYACQTGFNQVGGGVGAKHCSVSGLWQALNGDADPVCSRVECGLPPNIALATASPGSVGYYQDDVTYTCNNGYQPSGGTGRRVCAASGTWQLQSPDTDPGCSLVQCGFPPAVSDASPSDGSTGYFNDQVTYTCIAGKINRSGGSGRRVCTASGNWVLDSNDSDPVCATQCSQPPSVFRTTHAPQQATYSHPDYVIYLCNPGYEKLFGSNGHRYCSTSGVWTQQNSDPYCDDS